MDQGFLQNCFAANHRDDFVGLMLQKDEQTGLIVPKITFPYGWELTQVTELDVLLLLQTLSQYHSHASNYGIKDLLKDQGVGFPLKSYIVVIQNFLQNGYHQDREILYSSRAVGKIHWGYTIKKEHPLIQNIGPVYLTMQVRTHSTNDELLITQISKLCVYESLVKMGWYYRLRPSANPKTHHLKSLFIASLKERLNKTNKDVEKLLFQSMINVLSHMDSQHYQGNFCFGTDRFEKVWEFLVERVFGTIKDKEKKRFFPRALWYLGKQQAFTTNELFPDTIMYSKEGLLYVIDAKYYRYGIKKEPRYLPEMASIAKQVVYAQYIDSKKASLAIHPKKIRNIFILPFNRLDWKQEEPYFYAGFADSDLTIKNHQEYTKIHVLLMDTKHLMTAAQKRSMQEVCRLSSLIELYAD